MTLKTTNARVKFGIFPKLLIVLVLVSLLPLLVVWYISYQTSTERIMRSANERLQAFSDALVIRVNDWMDMNTRMLRENAQAPSMRSMRPESQRPILRLIKEEYPWIHSMLVIAPDGNAISRADDLPLKNYSDRRYVQQVLKGEPLGQQVLIGKTTGLPGFVLAVPIKDDEGGVKGILVASMAAAVISDFVTNRRMGDTGYAFLLDAHGGVIAHQSMSDATFRKDFRRHPAFQAHNRDGKSSLVYLDEERDETIIAYMKRTKGGWTLVTQQDYDEAFSAIASTHRDASIILLVTFLFVLVIAYILSRRLTRTLRHLTGIANEASMANFSALNAKIAGVDRSDEIGELARSVERLAVSLRVAMGRLQKKQ
jgi:methyl-accepting chemotaxis protein